MNDIEIIKEKFETGKIPQNEIDIETQKEILNLYKAEIESIREDITKIRKEIEYYKKVIKELQDK